jgi:hypothetical protein
LSSFDVSQQELKLKTETRKRKESSDVEAGNEVREERGTYRHISTFGSGFLSSEQI